MFKNSNHPEFNKKMVVAYARSRLSDPHTRIDDQLECIKQWIESNNLPWKIALTYRDDSRNILNVMDEIRRTLSDRGIDAQTIVVTSFDRLGRSNFSCLQDEVRGDFKFVSALENPVFSD